MTTEDNAWADTENFIQNMLYFHSAEAYYNMQNILKTIEFFGPGPRGLVELICRLLEEEKFVRPKEISRGVASLLKFDPSIKDVFSKISTGKLLGSLQEIIVDLSNVPLLLKLMEDSPLLDLEFEVVFKNIRSAILLSISKIKNNPETLTFQTALSLQCFINEYLYDQTDVEIEALKDLETLVEKQLTNGQQPSPTELACLASYKPLHEYSWLHLLTMPIELESLHRRQILEPEKEKQKFGALPQTPQLQGQQAQAVYYSAQAVGQIFDTIFNIGASRFDFDPLSQNERIALGEAWSPIFSKYFGDQNEWIMPVLITLPIILARLAQMSKIKKERELKEKYGMDDKKTPAPETIKKKSKWVDLEFGKKETDKG